MGDSETASHQNTAVKFLLGSPEPRAIAWGPELLAVCNDTFAALIGSTADGSPRPLSVLCSALWPQLSPMVNRAIRRGESAAVDDHLLCRFREGISEESYLRIACDPFVGDVTATAGVMVTLVETTDRVLAARRTSALRAVGEAAAASQSVRDACERVLAAMAHHPSDIPFALAYVCDVEAGVARLAATSALDAAAGARPEAIDVRSSADPLAWPVGRALTTNEMLVIDDVGERFGVLSGGDWPFAPRSAAIAPVTPPGRKAPEAVLIVGISARHLFDAPYRAFLELLVQQLAAAIAGGRVHEDEQRRAGARARQRARIRAMKAHFAGILEERTRLSREIHDTLLQGVTGISLQLRALLPRMQTSPELAAQALAGIVELAEKTSREAREAVWDLRPVSLNETDLAKTLEVAARRATAGTPIALRVTVSGEARRFPAARHTAIIRVVQESVANAVRHAVPRAIRVRLAFGQRRLRVVVADDGRGFVVNDDFRSYSGHFGLLGMRERAAAAGGGLQVRSVAGAGTTVTLIMPYGKSPATSPTQISSRYTRQAPTPTPPTLSGP